METTTCIVLCVLIVAWAAVKICSIYYKSSHYLAFQLAKAIVDSEDQDNQPKDIPDNGNE